MDVVNKNILKILWSRAGPGFGVESGPTTPTPPCSVPSSTGGGGVSLIAVSVSACRDRRGGDESDGR